jgi:putative transposase
MSLKMEFVERASKPEANVSALCREFGVSRETGHKWLRRFRQYGYDGLEEKSRRPAKSPLATAGEIVLGVLQAREAHPRWGPKKLVDVLRRRFGKDSPSRATIARILDRFGLVRRRRRLRPLSIVERAPEAVARACNDVWTVDFKGWWRAGDGTRCEPLTVRDAFSRYVLCAKLVDAATVEEVRREFETLFRRHGVPRAIQCDNGEPFISVRSRAGLTRLSAWWISLGITIVRSRPGCPQDNGGHERMHRDMSADVEAFPQRDQRSEQRAVDRWRQQFNQVRPHEALEGKTPAEVYRSAPRRSLVIARWQYPHGWMVRRPAAPNGVISIRGEQLVVGKAFVGHPIGIEPLDHTNGRLWLRDIQLGEVQLPTPRSVIDTACVRFLEKRRGRRPTKRCSPLKTTTRELPIED